MQAPLILTVGLDTPLLSARNTILRSAGYSTFPVHSIKEAADRFMRGKFDLVLLDDSLGNQDKDRIASLIRASGSATPVVAVVSETSPACSFAADVTIGSDPIKLRIGVRKMLARTEKGTMRLNNLPK